MALEAQRPAFKFLSCYQPCNLSYVTSLLSGPPFSHLKNGDGDYLLGLLEGLSKMKDLAWGGDSKQVVLLNA